MKKNKIIISLFCVFLALVAVSCTQETPYASGEPAEQGPKDVTRVNFSLASDGIVSSMELLPMTRAGEPQAVAALKNGLRVFVLRKIDDLWVVDQVLTKNLYDYKTRDQTPMPIKHEPDPSEIWDYNTNPGGIYTTASPSDTFYVTPDLLGWDFDLELREGDYKVVAVVNYQDCRVNQNLRPGFSFSESAAPQMLYYMMDQPPVAADPLDLYSFTGISLDVYYCATDTFYVPKSTSLAPDAPAPVVNLTSERVTARVRIGFKDYNEQPDKSLDFDRFPNSFLDCNFFLVATGSKKFKSGVDVFGNYVGEMDILHGRINATPVWTEWQGKGNYIFTRYRERREVYGNFFADPKDTEGVPATFGPMVMTRQQDDGHEYWWDDSAEFNFKSNSHNAFSFGISNLPPGGYLVGDPPFQQPIDIYYLMRPIDPATGLPEDLNQYTDNYLEYNLP